jgi:hypothetical protein
MSRRRQISAAILICAIAAMAGLRAETAYAADLPIDGAVKAARPLHRSAPAPIRLEDFAARPPNQNCIAWTDGCRSCGKNADGVTCSNVGIACLASEPRCTLP